MASVGFSPAWWNGAMKMPKRRRSVMCNPQVGDPAAQCRRRKRSVVPGRAWTTTASDRGVDDGEHRVAAGRRVIGEHHDRPAVGRDLDGAGQHALARQLGRRGRGQRRTVEAGTDAADVAGHGPRRRRPAASSASGANQSPRGPGQTPTGPSCGRGGAWSTTIGVPGSGPIGQREPPSITVVRPSAERESWLREPQHRRRRRCRRGRRGSPTGRPAAGPTSTVVAGRERGRRQVGRGRHDRRCRRADAEPAERLEHGSVGRVADAGG